MTTITVVATLDPESIIALAREIVSLMPAPEPARPALLSLTGACEYLSLDRQTITRLANAGKIERVKVGSKPLFRTESLVAFSRVGAPAEPADELAPRRRTA